MTNQTDLRKAIVNRMVELGDGVPQSVSEVARVAGCSQSALQMFLKGKRGAGVEMCIYLARYLNRPVSEVLTAAGHAQIAATLSALPLSSTHPATHARPARHPAPSRPS